MDNEIHEASDAVAAVQQTGRRPVGVTLIALFLFLYAAFLSIMLTIAVLQPQTLHTSNLRHNSDIAWELAYLTPLRIAMAIVLGVGIWKLKRWARKGLIALSGITVAGRTSVLMFPASNSARRNVPLTYAQAIEIAVCILLVGYLVSTRVSLVFEIGPQSDE